MPETSVCKYFLVQVYPSPHDLQKYIADILSPREMFRTTLCNMVGDKEEGTYDRTQASCRISGECNRSWLISFRIQPAEYGHTAESSSLPQS